MTTRLNQTHRDILRRFAREHVSCPREQKARDKAYARAAKLVLEAAEKAFPPADMAILEKYKVAYHDRCIRGGSPDGRFVGFTYDASDATSPLVPIEACGSRSLSFTPNAVAAIEAFGIADEALKRAKAKKLDAYHGLITASRTFEDVLEVWPAAEALRDRIAAPSTALVVLSSEVAEFIRHDNAGADARQLASSS